MAPVKPIEFTLNKDKRPLHEFIQERAKRMDQTFVGYNLNKKARSELADEAKYLMLSPCLSILLHFASELLNECWESRQAASCGLATLVEHLSLLQSQTKAPLTLAYAILKQEAKTQKYTSELKEVRAD